MTNIVAQVPAVSWMMMVGDGAPVGAAYPFLDAAKGSVYFRSGQTDDLSSVYMKVDNDGNDGDWVLSYSQSLALASPVTRVLQIPLGTGGGTSDMETFKNCPSINLDADGETFYAQFFVPADWDAASNLTLRIQVANEIAEDDGDDVSMSLTVNSYANGEAMSTAGQSVTVALNMTGGQQAINVQNTCTGTIVYNDGTYPVARGDLCTIKGVVNLGDTGEATGPLHVVSMWIEYTSDTFY